MALVAGLLSLGSPAAIAQRLPGGVTPTNYVMVRARPGQGNVPGPGDHCRDTGRAGHRHHVHAAEITFGEVIIIDAAGTQPARVTLDEQAETATLTVPRAVGKGQRRSRSPTPAC